MIKLILLLLLNLSCFATTTITGSVKDLAGNAVNSKIKIRAYLRGCAGDNPRVIGVASLVPTRGMEFFFDFTPNSVGAITGQLYSNDVNISCGGQANVTWYGIQIFYGGIPGPEIPAKAIDGGTLNLTNFTPINTIPVVPAPSGDATYVRLDSGNIPNPFTLLIASGSAVMTTAAISGGACGVAVTVSAPGVINSDTIIWSFSSAPAGTNGGLVSWATTDNVNFAYCPVSAETPAAISVRWRVNR